MLFKCCLQTGGCHLFPQNFCLGYESHPLGTPYDKLVQSQVFNRRITWVTYVLHWFSSMDADEKCVDLLYQAWYLEEMGPALGLYINFAKCEPFSSKGNTSFPPDVKFSFLPHLDILGAPVGYYLHCSRFITIQVC